VKIIGLTGGIGSGKTTVAKMFMDLGVPVYIADDEARQLTNRSKIIRRKLTALLGDQTYVNGKINNTYVANIIFNDVRLLQEVNQIIHPKVAKHFQRWVAKQEGVYCIKEVAILFENGGHEKCDMTVLVTAPKKERVARVLKRGGISEEAILARMGNQWPDKKKIQLADIVVENLDLKSTEIKIKEIHARLSKMGE